MGRAQTRSDEVYLKSRAYYLANREVRLQQSKEKYKRDRPAMLAAMQQGRDAARYARLLAKRPKRNDPRAIRAREFVLIQKQNKPCTDCHLTYPPYVMDFDHVRGTKFKDVSTLVAKGASLPTLACEIAKCELVCANCHRIRTHQITTS